MASKFDYRIPSLIEKKLVEFDKFFVHFTSQFFCIGISQKQMDDIVELMRNLLVENKNIIDYLLEKTSTQPKKIIEDVFGHSEKSLEAIGSQYKR